MQPSFYTHVYVYVLDLKDELKLIKELLLLKWAWECFCKLIS